MRHMKARERRRYSADDQADLDASARDEALRSLEGGGARVMLGKRVVLCQSPGDVEAALAGRIPPGAVRLDGRARG